MTVAMRNILGAAALFGFALAALAGEAEVRGMLKDRLRGDATIESVRRTPWGDLYEVVVRGPGGPQILYVDGAASVIISGQAIDAKSGVNVTLERKRELAAVKWDSLPLQWAITRVRGTGRRKIAVLSDPNCPHCRRFEAGLMTLEDITVYVLPYPIVKPESARQAKAVWCSADRAKAWDELMQRGIEPQAGTDCDNPVDQLVAFGRRLGANETPTWFVETGERYSGVPPLEETQKILDAASPPRR